MNLNLPNLLTLLRIVLIPVFVVLFYLPVSGSNVAATVVCAVAAWTDWFDGYLARRLKMQSELGAFLDPVADKLVVTIVLVLLVSKHPGWVLALPVVVIVGREIAISALREWMALVGDEAKVAVSIIGKFKTATQMLAIGFLLYEQPIGDFPVLEIGFVLIYVAAFLTLWSMVVYLRAAWPSLNGDSPPDA